MKKIRSVPKAPPETETPDPVDSVVEDLLQQDVLPADEGALAPRTAGPVEDAQSQAARWDEPVGAVGHRAPRQSPEDEVEVVEKLVKNGVNEADEELRELESEDEEE